MTGRRKKDPCPACGRDTGWRDDGQRRKHRVRDMDPTSPYCTEGAR